MKTERFVDQLYSKFFGRSADASGRAYWTQVIDSGEASAASATLHFLNSAEYLNVAIPISRLYYAAFGRVPDAGGLSFWLAQAKKGQSISSIANDFIRSTEFQTLYGKTTTDAAFVDLLYKNVLGRAGDTDGKAYWVARLTTDKMPRSTVLNAFADSPELIANKNAEIKVILQYQLFTGLTPSNTEIASALAQNDPIALLAKIYSSSTYTGVPVPYLNTRGVAVDGYLQSSNIFVDRNGNHLQDAGEISLSTDIQGNYNFKNQESFNGVLILQGGRDISIMRDLLISYSAPAGSSVISPLTTLYEKLRPVKSLTPDGTVSLLNQRLGIASTIDVTSFDPIAQSIVKDASATAVANALTAHAKAAIVNTDAKLIATVLLSTGIAKTTQVASDAAFDAITRLLAKDGQTGAVNFSDPDVLYELLASAALFASADTPSLHLIVQMQESFANLLANLNHQLITAVASDATSTLRKVAQIQYVADDLGRNLVSDVVDGNIDPTLDLGSGTNLITAVDAALSKLGQLIQDTTAPTLVSSTPADNVAPVLSSADIVLKFSENVFPGTGNIVVSNGVDTRNIAITDRNQVSFTADTVTINPSRDFNGGTNYSVTMASGVIVDRVNNPYAGISDKTTLNFGVPSFNVKLANLDGVTGARFDGIAPAGIVSVASAGDVNADGFSDFMVGASGDTNNGSTWVVLGKSTAFAASTKLTALDSKSGLRFDGVAGDDFSGYAVSSAGDVNGDSVSDIIIGAPGADPLKLAYAGSSYLIFGKKTGAAATTKLSSVDGKIGYRLDANTAGEWSGSAVSSADINGDGLSDLMIGANGSNSSTGAAYVVMGRTTGYSASLNLNSLTGANGFKISGMGANDNLGVSIAGVSDVNGDRIDDFIVGGLGANVEAGAAWLVFGKTTAFNASLDLATLDGSNGVRLNGNGTENLGRSVSSAGDINGDGINDLVIGAFHADGSAGASYVLFGKNTPFDATLDMSTLNGSDGFRLSGQAAGDLSGISVSKAGDVNGDGIDDLLIGAREAQGKAGSAYLLYGKQTPFAADLALGALNGIDGMRLDGVAGDLVGVAVTGAGDVNGDGYDDIVIGAQEAQSGAGSAYLFFGGNFSSAVTFQGTSKAETLTGSASGEVFIAGVGSDTIHTGGGPDVVHAGAGDDLISVSDFDFRLIDGGGGIKDIIKLTGSGMDFDVTSIGHRLRSLEIIDIIGTGDNSITINASNVLQLSPVTNSININGNTGDAVHLVGSWTAGTPSTSGQTWVSGQAIVVVSAGVVIDRIG